MFRVTSARLRAASVAFALTVAAASAASAASLQLTAFAPGDAAGAKAAQAAFLNGTDPQTFGLMSGLGATPYAVKRSVSETFKGMKAWNGSSGTTNPGETAVGSFKSLGGTGTGHSAINGGHGLEVRNDVDFQWGRHGLFGKKWLDSNDTKGMHWEVGGLKKFNFVTFMLTDVADVGAKFSIKVGDTLYSNLVGAATRTANGTIHLVQLMLEKPVDHLVLKLKHNKLNDGFGIDGITVAKVAAVPLPAAGWMLVAGLGALLGLRRRQAI